MDICLKLCLFMAIFTTPKALTIGGISPSTPPRPAQITMKATTSGGSRLLLIRHGRTEMNEYLSKPGQTWGAPGFRDPGLYDTTLTSIGRLQASQLNLELRTPPPNIDLLVCSPLKRALETASLVFEGVADPVKMISPLASERVFLSSDIGSSGNQLARLFPDWQDAINEGGLGDRWWYTPLDEEDVEEWRPPGSYICPGEPTRVFNNRMKALMMLLRSREERTIAVVAHWGVIHAISGQSLENCAVHEMRTSELPDEPFVLEEDK